jgi:hypothetical protein
MCELDCYEEMGRSLVARFQGSRSVTSKLNDYINQSCFVNPPVVSADGGTGFGNTRPGIVHGPSQAETDLSIFKNFSMSWPREGSQVQFRIEAFNAFNTPNFADRGNYYGSPTFGQINSTSLSPRIIQFALKYIF